jgi:hypothetical protein
MDLVPRFKQWLAEPPPPPRPFGSKGGSDQAPRKGLFGQPPAPLMDNRERLYGFVAATALAIAFAVIWIPHLHQASVVLKGRHTSPVESLGFGLAMAAILAWATVVRRRWLVGLVAVYIGFVGPWNVYIVLGYAWVAFGGWLVIKNSKLQIAESKKAQPAGGTAAPARGARPAAPASGKDRGRGRGKEKVDATGRPIPAPSRRYTPPATPGKHDRKTRRERREAAARGELKPPRRSTPTK